MGPRRLLLLYVCGGLVSGVGQVLWPLLAPKLNIPGRYRHAQNQPCLGASGAINSVVALSVLAAPRREILLFFVLPLPAFALGALFLSKDLAGVYYGDTEQSSASHVMGAMFGAAYWLFLRRRPFHR